MSGATTVSSRCRPWLLSLVIAWFCAENLIRAALSASQARELADLPTAMSPYYVAAISAGWCIAFATNLAIVWLRPAWTVPVSVIVMMLYQANLWLNRLAFAQSSEAAETAGFRAILTLASFAALAAGLTMAQCSGRRRK
ncbi:MAG: hypothetical protein ACUVRU_08135 [Anaerolineae bacterium]